MSGTTLSAKGQITIPATVRVALDVDVGDRIEFVETAPGRFEVIAATLPVTALKGLITAPAEPVSIDDMNTAIRERAKRVTTPIRQRLSKLSKRCFAAKG